MSEPIGRGTRAAVLVISFRASITQRSSAIPEQGPCVCAQHGYGNAASTALHQAVGSPRLVPSVCSRSPCLLRLQWGVMGPRHPGRGCLRSLSKMKGLALFAAYPTRLNICSCNLEAANQRWLWVMLLEVKHRLAGVEKLLETIQIQASFMFRVWLGHAHCAGRGHSQLHSSPDNLGAQRGTESSCSVAWLHAAALVNSKSKYW